MNTMEVEEIEKTIVSKHAHNVGQRMKKYVENVIQSTDIYSDVSEFLRVVLSDVIADFRNDAMTQLWGGKSDKSIADIFEYVCDNYMVTPEQVMSRSRKREIVEPRQIICWMIRNKVAPNSMALSAIGEMFSNGKSKFDHATVLYSVRSIDNMIETDVSFRHRMMVHCNELGAKMTWDGTKLKVTGYKPQKKQNESTIED